MRVAIVVAVAVLVPGSCLLLGLAWLRRRWLEQERQAIALRIVPPVEKFGKASPAETERLRSAAQRRREEADEQRREAHRIETGQPADERLRLVVR